MENGTVRLVLVPEVARAAARMSPLRVKLTTDNPKPEFTKPPPVIVKLAGGTARSIGLGAIELTALTDVVDMLNVAVTEVSPLTLSIQIPAPVHPPPLQPVNEYPGAAVGVNVTTVPLE